MSNIARQLCDEIVEPVWQQSSTIAVQPSCHGLATSSTSQYNNPAKSIIIEKKTFLKKARDPSTSKTNRLVVSECKETALIKRLIKNEASNTIATGPLKCDNECITLIRKRDNSITSSCKCSQKQKPFKRSMATAKENTANIQCDPLIRKNFGLLDKACNPSVTTSSFGINTQLMDRVDTGIKAFTSVGLNTLFPIKSDSSINIDQTVVPDKYVQDKSNVIKKNYYIGARRWAISKYPSRGPDF